MSLMVVKKGCTNDTVKVKVIREETIKLGPGVEETGIEEKGIVSLEVESEQMQIWKRLIA